jgi:DNA-binding response OmpR family regulator
MSTKIAIVEDDAAIAQMYRMKFDAEGYIVQVANNGRLGLQLIEEMRPDIILLDLMMPEMNGEEMLTALRKTEWGKNIKVIILTNRGEQEIPEEIKNMGVDALILKAAMTPKQVAELVKMKVGENQ